MTAVRSRRLELAQRALDAGVISARRIEGCPADVFGLGWVPGIAYRVWTGQVDVCVGYHLDGRVSVRDEATGQVRAHRTRIGRGDHIIGDTWEA